MPTSRMAKKAILSLIPPSSRHIYELGSGWGHLVFPLAKAHPAAQIHAFEISPIPWIVSKWIHFILRYPNLLIERRDFLNLDLEGADCVVCYLYPGAMRRLKDKFDKELKADAVVISNSFFIPGWGEAKVITVGKLIKTNVYLFRKSDQFIEQ